MTSRERAQGEPQRGHFPILLFDGECGLCSATIQFILRHERTAALSFAPLQSEIGKEMLVRAGLDGIGLSTLVLVEKECAAFTRSSAVLRVAWRHLRFPYRIGGLFLVLPTPLRDAAYRFIARRRFRWFSGSAACALPDPATARRFVSPP